MKLCLVLVLLLCSGTLHMASGLSCCTDQACKSTVTCGNGEDACFKLTPQAGQVIRKCFSYKSCNPQAVGIMFPDVAKFTLNCCQSNQCNSGNRVTMATPILALIGSLLSVWWWL
ncbi:short neurotoxin 1-like [Mugil cephalus]|uniref:short neurotoxin 1-like n=1 Tax=Mugil cephalus TaxID=48193 RepID=UPI001FB56F0D|nr:short neurotoxin 1-like [Mugil cephalus]XP_047453044.1 short neurotoxin 1-like [Mugil cephalus]XP_047453045.1 short neurotoxin 1-like [Mugil cephalus]